MIKDDLLVRMTYIACGSGYRVCATQGAERKGYIILDFEKIRKGEQKMINAILFGVKAGLALAAELGRNAYGFEIDRIFYQKARSEMLKGYITN